MKRFLKNSIAVLMLVLLTHCELIDPTVGVINPNITLDKIIGQPGSTGIWINGLRRQMTIVYNNLIVNLEIASDNYVNTNTFYDQQMDGLTFIYQNANINNLQFSIADLRQSADAGIQQLFPADPSATVEQEAELYFYRGWAKLLAGEIFVALPLTPGGIPATPVQNIDAAIADFLIAEQKIPTSVSYKLALARAYYAKGEKANAVTKANEAIAFEASSFTSRVDASIRSCASREKTIPTSPIIAATNTLGK